MNWFSANEEQKDFIKYTLTQRLIGSIYIDINNFTIGKYSKDSKRIDALFVGQDEYNKIIHILASFKEALRTIEYIKIPELITKMYKILSSKEEDLGVKFKTLNVIDSSITEYESLDVKDSKIARRKILDKFIKLSN